MFNIICMPSIVLSVCNFLDPLSCCASYTQHITVTCTTGTIFTSCWGGSTWPCFGSDGPTMRYLHLATSGRLHCRDVACSLLWYHYHIISYYYFAVVGRVSSSSPSNHMTAPLHGSPSDHIAVPLTTCPDGASKELQNHFEVPWCK